MKPDYSAWLTPERVAVEETAWAEARFYEEAAAAITALAPRRVLELGCGTGWVPTCLPPEMGYLGVDANPHCLARAREKNPRRPFVQDDIRTFIPTVPFDLVCAFAVLKHFALAEWVDIVTRILSMAPAAIITMPIASEEREDAFEFPHVWVTKETLRDTIKRAGHAIVRTWGEPEWYIVTARHAADGSFLLPAAVGA